MAIESEHYARYQVSNEKKNGITIFISEKKFSFPLKFSTRSKFLRGSVVSLSLSLSLAAGRVAKSDLVVYFVGAKRSLQIYCANHAAAGSDVCTCTRDLFSNERTSNPASTPSSAPLALARLAFRPLVTLNRPAARALNTALFFHHLGFVLISCSRW